MHKGRFFSKNGIKMSQKYKFEKNKERERKTSQKKNIMKAIKKKIKIMLQCGNNNDSVLIILHHVWI